MILTHGANSLERGGGTVPEQEYDSTNVPNGVQIFHDFGEGLVPAVPMDTFTMSDSFVSVNTKNKAIVDTFAMSDSFFSVEQIN